MSQKLLPTVEDPKTFELSTQELQMPLTEVSADTDLDIVTKSDSEIVNFVFANLASAWQEARGVDNVCKMSMMTFKALKERRDLLRLPYGNSNTKKEASIVYPID